MAEQISLCQRYRVLEALHIIVDKEAENKAETELPGGFHLVVRVTR